SSEKSRLLLSKPKPNQSMKSTTASLSLALLASGFLAASADAQLTLNDTYETRSDPNNGRLGQRWRRTEVGPPAVNVPSGEYVYATVTSVAIRADGSGVPSGELGLGRRFNAGIFYFQLPEL